jgi:hypothetical protein
MDLSGAYLMNCSNQTVFTDCSGQEYLYLNNTNIPESTPAPFEGSNIPSNDRDLDLFRRYLGTDTNRGVNPTPAQDEQSKSRDASDEESEDDCEVHHDNEVVTQEEVNQFRAYLEAGFQRVQQQSLIRPELLLFYSLQFVNLVWAFLTTATQVTKKISTNVYRGFQAESYYFFKDSAVPWDARRVNLSSAGSPHVDWYYNAETKTFRRQENDGHLHHFPYLTAEIYHGDLALYDITSFTESLRWTGGETAPSANHVLAAWYIDTGVLLDPSLPLVLRVINEEGDQTEIPLHTQSQNPAVPEQSAGAAAAPST